ncbi:MAG TPA: hypothetical protein VHY76_00550 [Acetobacteraceae bacterium]|nr:hypothetical protein [Acetobacteraceae bacterium]
MHRARAALAQAAAEARIVEPQMVAQGIQQRHLGVGVDGVLLTIDIEDEVPDHETPPGAPIGWTWRADPRISHPVRFLRVSLAALPVSCNVHALRRSFATHPLEAGAITSE